jgi:hypothetical protein
MTDFWDSLGDALPHDRPPADAVPAMLRRAAANPEPVAPRHPVRFAISLLLAQTRLIRLSVWTASVLVMAFGVVLARTGGTAGTVLASIAPFVTAAGIAAVCGPEPEVAAATITPPRLVLLARVTLVFGYDLILALLASVLIATPALPAVIGSWLGPMALLSALCLLLSVAAGTTVAVTACVGLWLAHLLGPGLAGTAHWLTPVADALTWLWATNLLTGLLAMALFATAVAWSTRPAFA